MTNKFKTYSTQLAKDSLQPKNKMKMKNLRWSKFRGKTHKQKNKNVWNDVHCVRCYVDERLSWMARDANIFVTRKKKYIIFSNEWHFWDFFDSLIEENFGKFIFTMFLLWNNFDENFIYFKTILNFPPFKFSFVLHFPNLFK